MTQLLRWRLASRVLRLWLFHTRCLLLSWFVLFVIPVTQEVGMTSEDVSTEKSSHLATQLKPTPHLVSLSQTETIVVENIDANSLIVSPSIAAATPVEDIKSPNSVSNFVRDDESGKHASDKELGQKEESQTETLNEEIISESKTEQFDENTNLEKDQDDDDFEIQGPDVNNQDTRSDLPVQTGIINNDDGLDDGLEKGSESSSLIQASKQDDTSQTKDTMNTDNQDDTKQDLKFSEEETIDHVETVTWDVDSEDKEPLDESVEDSQDTKGDVDLVGTHDDHEGPQEDMPSFKEWSKKFLAQEEEKNKVQQSNEKVNPETNTQTKKTKSERKQNNYASVDCGANVLENNIEAQNAASILLENKDFYMLNPCSANIWFIVELCDHVQVKSLQLANFELFSSTIKKFQVSFSTRYPTREWAQIQTFTARSEKAVQTFNLEPIFAKYMKVEQLSYHGSEHYCPWSLLRVYGNSMVEEYEEHENSQERGPTVDNENGALSNVKEDQHVSGGILQTATDAVLNFVKETAKKLVKTQGNSSDVDVNSTEHTGLPEQSLNSETPRSIVQLMDHEDFEASCHESNGDELLTSGKLCLPGTPCSSTESQVSSHQRFFEIIYNVCRRDFRNDKACFNNLTKGIKSTAVATLNSEPKSKNIVWDKGVEKHELVKNGSQSEGGSSSDEEQSDKNTKVETIETTDKIVAEQDSSLDASVSSQTSSTFSSAEVMISENTTVIPTILPSSSSSSSSSSQSVTADMVNHSSSPTPLAQPPLDVKQLPDTEEQLSEPTVKNPEGLEGYNENPVVTSNDLIPDSSATIINSGQLSATKHATPNQVSMETISSESIEFVSQDKLISSISDNTASTEGGETNHESRYQERPGDDGQNLMVESMKGTNEEKSNHDVDVLEITLTDEETKEATAEPEQMVKNDLDLSGISEMDKTFRDGTMNDTDVPNELPSQVDSGSSSLKQDPGTLDIFNESESKGKDEFGNHEKNEAVEITSKKESEEEEEEEIENEKIEGKLNMDITQENSKVDEIVEHDILEIDYVINSGCDENEVETYEEETKNEKKKIQADSDGLHAGDPGPTISVGNGQTNSKKESIFVAMSRKIKALEQNVTMTNLFLEELSQRYRKSIDEIQKKIDKNLSVMSKHSKLLTQVNLSQNITILVLTSRLQKVEEELNEATLRLKVVNQEVVERHVLGMCIQFIIFLLIWYFRRNPSVRNTENGGNAIVKIDQLKHGVHVDGNDKVGNGDTKNPSVEDIGHDSMENRLEEFTLFKSPSSEATADGKRRRRRRNRPLSVTTEPSLKTSQGQNIVTETAGLLFHTPGCHEKGENMQEGILKDATQRSCSADGLNDISRMKDERKMNTKRSAASPKTKKIGFRDNGKIENGTSKVRSDLFNSNCNAREEVDGQKGLFRSKSVEECYGNGVNSYNNDFTSAQRKMSSPTARCSMQSDSCDKLNNQKSKWIWGFG